MRPNIFKRIEEIPFDFGGEIAKQLLPVVHISEKNSEVIEIFCEILKIDSTEMEIDENIFDFGADSLDLIRILAEISKKIELDKKEEEELMKR